jgi:hypothetical protein
MPTLPSAIYIPHREEFPKGSFPLPWNDAGEPAIVGQFARDRGALVPDRLATSAKSWLSNPHIDPKQRILPWRSDIAEEKLSPLECSRRYLQHLRDALLYAERAAPGRDRGADPDRGLFKRSTAAAISGATWSRFGAPRRRPPNSSRTFSPCAKITGRPASALPRSAIASRACSPCSITTTAQTQIHPAQIPHCDILYTYEH